MKDWNNIKNKVFENSSKKSVLLGNGFSLTCIGDNVTSKTLVDKVNEYFKNTELEEKIANIEDYISKIETQFITELYDLLPEEKINKLPNIQNLITDFLQHFDNFYTLNYDPILYFLLMNLNEKFDEDGSDDGFRGSGKNSFWQPEKANQNTFYLHGAFHLVRETSQKIRKIVRGDKNLLQTIKDEWEKGTKSHLVIASDSETKNLKLSNEYSEYLAYGYENFQNLEGILVTVGVSFSDSDKHIVEAINNNNNLKHIYLGCYTDNDLKQYEEIFKNNKKVTYFSTKDMFKSKRKF